MNFTEAINNTDDNLLRLKKLQTLQVNLGNRCNLQCKHCHVQAGPNGKNIMSKEVMNQIIAFVRTHGELAVDMTGGCPELNPDFKYFIDSIYRHAEKTMIRTNLSVFFEPGLDWVPQWYADHKIVVIASLPCYTKENVNGQRGNGVFDKSIEAIKILNALGYGKETDLEFNLVYNPGGEFLPGDQQQLKADYKQHLLDDFGVTFDKLFTITNAPIGRFRQYLDANGILDSYLKLLEDNFNPASVENIMCRSLVSIDYRGIVYNCDFNQALDLPLIDIVGKIVTIENLDHVLADGIDIITDRHCFCCTAGAGSSCTGSLAK